MIRKILVSLLIPGIFISSLSIGTGKTIPTSRADSRLAVLEESHAKDLPVLEDVFVEGMSVTDKERESLKDYLNEGMLDFITKTKGKPSTNQQPDDLLAMLDKLADDDSVTDLPNRTISDKDHDNDKDDQASDDTNKNVSDELEIPDWAKDEDSSDSNQDDEDQDLGLVDRLSKKLSKLILATKIKLNLATKPEPKKPNTLDDIKLDGMVGKLPQKMVWLMLQFNKPKEKGNSTYFNHRMLLYGPPGNGKTTYAKKFADYTKSIFMERSASSLVEKFIGTGPANVIDLFKTASTWVETTGKKVVILIDEIDALAGSGEFRVEHENTIKQIWLELDRLRKNPKYGDKIFVIFATNKPKKLNIAFMDRLGGNTIEIRNPIPSERRAILKLYLKEAKTTLSLALITELVKNSKGLSCRSLEDFIATLKMTNDINGTDTITDAAVLKTLEDIKKKFEGNTSDQEGPPESKLQRSTNMMAIAGTSVQLILNTYALYELARRIVGGNQGTTVGGMDAVVLGNAVLNLMKMLGVGPTLAQSNPQAAVRSAPMPGPVPSR